MTVFFFFKPTTAYDMRISDLSSVVFSSDLHRGAFVQILIEEGQHHLLAELRGGVAIPRELAEAPALAVDLAVPPRPHDEVVVAPMARRFERFPTRDRAVPILLIPQPLFPDRGDVGGVGGDQLVERLPLPIFVIACVLPRPVPTRQLFVTTILNPRPPPP